MSTSGAIPPATSTEPGAREGIWRQRPFRMLAWSRFSSRVANNAVNFALVLLVVQETGLALMSSLLVLALVIPTTLSGLVAGVTADVWPKRPQIFLGNVIKGLFCIGFVAFDLGLAGYFILAFSLATFGQFAGSAESAVLPAIVEKADLVRANAVIQALNGLAQIIGFGAVTPLFLRLFDQPEFLILVMGALYLVAGVQGVLIGRVPPTPDVDVGKGQGSWLLAGWREMVRQPAVKRAAIQLTLISTALIILGGIIPAYLSEELGLPVDLGAIVLMPAAAGVAIGLRFAHLMARFVQPAVLASVGFTGFVICLASLAFVNEEAQFLGGYGMFAWLNSIDIGNFDGGAALAMMLVGPMGLFYALVMVAGQTTLNDMVPLYLQGRVLATQAALAGVASSVPVMIAGALTDVVGAAPVLAGVAVVIGLTAVFTTRRARSVTMPMEVGTGP